MCMAHQVVNYSLKCLNGQIAILWKTHCMSRIVKQSCVIILVVISVDGCVCRKLDMGYVHQNISNQVTEWTRNSVLNREVFIYGSDDQISCFLEGCPTKRVVCNKKFHCKLLVENTS